MKFNTAISYIMIYVNELYKHEKISKELIEKFDFAVVSFCPHISEELWERLGNHESSIHLQNGLRMILLIREEYVTVVFQVNGKIRSKQEFDFDTDNEDTLEDEALNNENVKKYMLGKQIVKIITVKNKMVNIVVK